MTCFQEAEMFHGNRYGHGFGPFSGRMFNKGDFKYLILELIKDKPKHGYEIIRELEERFHGWYSPSPGSVYPTLQWLEEMGYATSSQQDGKKIYAITEAGLKFLESQEKARQDIRDQMKEQWCWWSEDLHDDIHDVMNSLRDTIHGLRHKAKALDGEKLRRIKDIVAEARTKIEDVLK
jgi:DNA-binding PadR family transcriptional regulator